MKVRAEPGRELGAAWQRHMLRGEFGRAWEISDAVLAKRRGRSCSHLPLHEQWVWDGTPLDGRRVLVRCNHGLGDTLQFIRYAPLVRERAAELTVAAQPTLLPVLRAVAGADRWTTLPRDDARVEYDVDVESMELPYVFRTTLQTLPARVPYLDVARAALEPTDRPKVGIIWKAGDWAPHRSLPFGLVASLLDVPVQWYILQSEHGLAECPPDRGIVAGTSDPLELAGVMRALDLVITIDSMPAHLAGALATPVWTLLPASADWRWMEGRDDSPWYPTMRLFRQPRPGEWAPAIARLHRALRAIADEGTYRTP